MKRGKGLLGDFGLSRHASEEEKFDFNSLLPTINELYCPADVIKGNPYTKSSDIYQFGILFWEMLMLRKWTKRDQLNGTSYCLQLLSAFPRVFVKIIAKCFCADSELRPQFCELLEDFSKLNQFECSTYREVGEPLGFPLALYNM